MKRGNEKKTDENLSELPADPIRFSCFVSLFDSNSIIFSLSLFPSVLVRSSGQMRSVKPTVVGGKLKLKSSSSSSAKGSASKSLPTTIAVPSSSAPSSSSSSTELKKRSFEEHNSTNTETSSPPSSSTSSSLPPSILNNDVQLTEAQKRFKLKQMTREKEEAKKLVKTNYRERIENYNQKLAKLTEHNDVPRVSAAGNG